MTRRGEPLPINQAMNRPRAKLGLDLPTWMAIVFVNVTVFLVGFRLLAILSFPTMAVAAWLKARSTACCSSSKRLETVRRCHPSPRRSRSFATSLFRSCLDLHPRSCS